MSLRPIVTGDLAALATLHAACFDRPWPAEELWDLIARPGAVALLVEGEDGAPSPGFILIWQVAGEGEVLTLAVDPAARRQGVARTLLAAALQACDTQGVEAVWLEVAEDNAAALALYRDAGFEETGRRPGYYRRPGGEPVDALVLRRRLTPASPAFILG